MKITYSWIKEFVDVAVSPQVLSDRLSMAGLSVACFSRVDDDWFYDIEVTSNRPDWLSVRGIAREVAAVTGAKFKPAFFSGGKKDRAVFGNKARKTQSLFNVVIEDKDACPLYCAGLVKDIKVADSPDWLKRRLQSVGLRPVNNVVDITNYLMLVYGQPLHAFDFEKIKGAKVVVRRGRAGEELVLLDGSRQGISSEVLVIADAEVPLASAGIMGGRHCEVSQDTSCVLFESACFDPGVVRRGARLLGIASDSSYRFERGIDIADVKEVLVRACRMAGDICHGEPVEIKAAGRLSVSKAKRPQPRITFSLRKANDMLGIDISASQAKRILEKLGFSLRVKNTDILEVGPPSFRRDVTIAEDVVEEIARIHGYDNVPATDMAIKAYSVVEQGLGGIKARLEGLMVSMGLKEVITYSLEGQEDYKRSAVEVPEDVLLLRNPISQERHILRTTLLNGLLDRVTYNVNHGNKNMEFFEIARVFKAQKEPLSLGIVLAGGRRTSWKGDICAYSLFDMKGVLETIAQELQAGEIVIETSCGVKTFESGMGFIAKINDEIVARFGRVSQEVKRAWDIKIKDDIFMSEIDVELLCVLAKPKKVFKPYGVNPAIVRDLSLIVPGQVSFRAISALILALAAGYAYEVSLVETYHGKEIPDGASGMTISIEYRCADATLTEALISPVHELIIKRLKEDFGVVSR